MKYLFVCVWKLFMLLWFLFMCVSFPAVKLLCFLWDFKTNMKWRDYSPCDDRDNDNYIYTYHDRPLKNPMETLRFLLNIKEKTKTNRKTNRNGKQTR